MTAAAALVVLLSPGPGNPELADPYVTFLGDSVIVSGTGPYHLKFRALRDLAKGGPFEVEPNDFWDSSWDLRPVAWSSTSRSPRLWDPRLDRAPARVIWYGGRMRPGASGARWPRDNFSRDVFAFTQTAGGLWRAEEASVFAARGDWPRADGDYLGHRYGSQIVMRDGKPVIYYEQVTHTRANGQPLVTELFVDELADPLRARGRPTRLVSPIDSRTGQPYPSAVREDGSSLVEGPLAFRLRFGGELWEAIAFSAGSYYGRYPACFASRRVAEGRRGKPYRVALNSDGSDLFDGGAALGAALRLEGGPGRPSVIVDRAGKAIADAYGRPQVLFHAYRQDKGPNRSFRSIYYAALKVTRGPNDALRFEIVPPAPPAPVRRLRSPVSDDDRTVQPELRLSRPALAQPERAAGNQLAPDRS